ncbi:hypothetical protein [Nonomuraea dietziae]|uniref:hypothetical protein n=1 Tax=Nonomuraea dietziae TaxID=65515 RepID=UPI00342D5CC4
MTYLRIAAFALMVAACSPGEGGGGSYGAAVQPTTVEQLAAKAGCTPHIQIDASELRQGHCETADGEFFLTTFTTQQGKDAWMDTAPEYNPHLVGPLWTALSSRPVLERVQRRLGGDLHLKDHRVKG